MRISKEKRGKLLKKVFFFFYGKKKKKEKNGGILHLKIGNTNIQYGIPKEEQQWDM